DSMPDNDDAVDINAIKEFRKTCSPSLTTLLLFAERKAYPRVKPLLYPKEKLLVKIQESIAKSKQNGEREECLSEIAIREIDAFFHKASFLPFFASNHTNRKPIIMRVMVEFYRTREALVTQNLQYHYNYSHKEMYDYYHSMIAEIRKN